MPGRNNIVKQNGRVLYVEPNDVFEKVNGVPLPPDYSDLCISFNLTVEIVHRFKDSTGQGENRTSTYSISWADDFDPDRESKHESHYISFMRGTDRHFTTFYTDTSYNDIKEQTIVEGLGVDSVDVSFESFYAPTVTIKFVDQRGSSLFGREEVAHNTGNVSIDNVFGAFFTSPYPKFKLQIKGFFGKPVTYQLTCSGFKGNFNSSTGNFEATATFIAYSYSLLTDIPFQYIVAAPYCSYAGMAYWEAHKKSNDWRPYGTNEMIRIHDFIEKVNSCFKDSSLFETKGPDVSDYEAKNKLFGRIRANIMDALIRASIDFGGKNFIPYTNIAEQSNEPESLQPNGSEHQVVWLVDNENPYLPDRNKNAWKTSITEINIAGENKYLMDIGDEKNIPTTLTTTKLFTYDSTKGEYSFALKDENGSTVPFNLESLLNYKFDNAVGDKKVRLNRTIAAEIIKNAKERKPLIKEYIIVFNVDDTLKYYYNKQENIRKDIRKVQATQERDYLNLAKAKLNFIPYIGNIFKMIMCHIETLVHIMYVCYQNITVQHGNMMRTPSYLNVNMKDTDVIIDDTDSTTAVNSIHSIPPWPLINANNDKSFSYSTYEKENTIGWVGDISPGMFEEEYVVKSLFIACKYINKQSNGTAVALAPIRLSYVPVIPMDIVGLSRIFPNATKDVDDVIGMIGIRMAQIIGVMGVTGDTMLKTIGAIDAMNLFTSFSTSADVKQFISTLSKVGDVSNSFDNQVKNIIEILQAKDSDVTTQLHYSFERKKLDHIGNYPLNKRHPMYVNHNNDDYLYYTYIFDSNCNAIVPSRIENWDNYFGDKGYFTYDSTGGCFRANISVIGNPETVNISFGIYNMTTDKFLSGSNVNNAIDTKMVNYNMFNVIDDRNIVDGIVSRYSEIAKGTISINGKSVDFKNINLLDGKPLQDEMHNYFNKYWSFYDVFNKYSTFDLHLKMSLTDSNQTYKIKTNAGNEKLTDEIIKKFRDKDKVEYTENGEIKEEQKNNRVRRFISVIDSNTEISLFGSELYFHNMPNNTTSDNADKPYCVKALLLLHSIVIPTGEVPNFSNKRVTNGTIQLLPKAYVYLLGGLLWRSRQTTDPIISKGGYKLGDYKSNTLYVREGNTFKFKISKKEPLNYYTIKELFGGDLPDYYIQNVLIEKFLSFARTCYSSILRYLEFTVNDNEGNFDNVLKCFKIESNNNSERFEAENQYNYTLNTTEAIKNIVGENAKVKMAYGNLISQYYTFYYKDGEPGIELVIADSNEAQFALIDLCEGRCVVTDMSRGKVKQNADLTDIVVKKDEARSYLKSLLYSLDQIAKETAEVNQGDANKPDLSDEDLNEFNRDLAVPIYLYLKMLWDKWLCDVSVTEDDNPFYVKQFYNNFVFIDSFYRNIEYRFMVNCQVFLDCYDNNAFSNRDITVFKFLGDITTNHHCLFVAVPDFISGLASGDVRNNESMQRSIDALEAMFRPVPFRELEKIRNNNRFCIIYVPKLSEYPSSMNGFKDDWFNIWSYNDETDTTGLAYNMSPTNKTARNSSGETEYSNGLQQGTPRVLADISTMVTEKLNSTSGPPGVVSQTSSNLTSDDVNRYGYYVPAFGISYGYQNNHLFKNIQLNMETPIITSSVINTLSHIAAKGASSAHRIAYVGQDTYPVFSNYSYICEFDMMGNAQIQPLMYFQLTNIPMWRGTYMVFNVTHSMKPGDMTTHVKAMKLSNRAVPYSNAWFTKNLNYRMSDIEAWIACLEQIAGGNVTPVVQASEQESGTEEQSSSNTSTVSTPSGATEVTAPENPSQSSQTQQPLTDVDKLRQNVTIKDVMKQAKEAANFTLGTNNKLKLSNLLKFTNYICIGHDNAFTIQGNWRGLRSEGSEDTAKSLATDMNIIGESNCTAGPKSWYYLAGGKKVDLHFWNEGDNSKHIMKGEEYFDVVFKVDNGKASDVNNKLNTYLRTNPPQPGDILTVKGGSGRDGRPKHACMWDGNKWRSDFLQNNAWVYGSHTDRADKTYLKIYRLKDEYINRQA